ncbi:MAG: RsmB/NOP family class I SAM-dependent RNA methyltransferase [Rhodobacteraceae bacterium]|nr:RsmB/NOP family class I SAM-dependent RNA methyltransferase [Paracoccaceae bacterium]
MSAPGYAPRAAAAHLLNGVLIEHRLLSDMVNSKDGPLAKLPPQGKARAQSLAGDTLRHLGRIDIVIDQFLQKEPPTSVRNALRLATCELIVDGIPPHAAVDAVVRLVKNNRQTTRMAGMANAVARRISEHGAEIWADLEPTELPAFLAKPIRNAYGADALAAIELAHENGAPLDITLQSPADTDELVEALEASVLSTGSLRLFEWGQISTMPGFEDGAWWVQDAAAAIPAQLLGDITGKTVLDICAAPGGKTMQLAAAGGDVTALDLSKYRMERVQENLNRTKLKAKIVVADALKYRPEELFDAILLDAPCSATGTIRRHPDLPHTKADLDLQPVLDLQKQMLNRAASWLKPGGLMVYCTCSLLPQEGETQVEEFLKAHPDYEQLPVNAENFGLMPEWIDDQGGMRLRPDFWADRGGMDGFYAAILKKRG